ncbi:MAG: MotA/TolQ/ExbB proton channel family protein [Phycisphaeraceae bacterium]|nr:MotA/TolQ/ExbB proton channel family protein [Phycisphaeraceae bacterium]
MTDRDDPFDMPPTEPRTPRRGEVSPPSGTSSITSENLTDRLDGEWSDHDDGRRLDASSGDIESWIGFSTGRYTRPSGALWFTVSALLTSLGLWGLSMVPEWPLTRVMFQSWTNGVVMFLGLWCVLMLANKLNKTRIQERALKLEDLFPNRADFVLSPATAQEVLQSIRARCDRPREFLLFNRLNMALSNLGNIGEVRDVGAVLESQADADASAVQSSYTSIRALIWVIPVLGFIGTVIGLSEAIGSFQGVLERPEGADAASLRDRLTPVVLGLRTAFETTLVALLVAVAIQLITTFVYRREEDLLDGCTQYCNDHVISRLKLTDL